MTQRITRERSSARAKLLREFSDRQFTIVDLLQIFGEAFKAKFHEAPTRHQVPGKHFHHGRHAGCRYEHPAGTKLARRFIRGSGRESTYNRKLYAYMTGHQYTGASS